MKKRIFIGSSSEQLATLNKVIDLLGDEYDCIPWTDAFGLNASGLDSLIKQTRLADYSILLATKDDVTKERGESLTKPRDNVIFEFGLFLGAAGADRCYLLAEKTADLPSDLDGINLAKFGHNEDEYDSLENIVNGIKRQMSKMNDMSQLGLLPSTALAIGYFHGFVRRVCEELHKSSCIVVEDKKIKVKNFKIDIIIPDNLDDNGVDNFISIYNKNNSLSRATTCTDPAVHSERGYPFHFKVDPPEADPDVPMEIHLSDIPRTLNTIVESLKLYLPSNQIGLDFDIDYLEKRELENFAKVLQYLISRNVATKKYVNVFVNVAV